MPYFFVDDGFGDSKEIMAIAPRYRNAAVGLWTRCGAWSAGKLEDGFVPADVLQMFGAKPNLIAALVDDAGLWDRVDGGIQFRNWAKWQRTREQVVSYRERQSEKKRAQREAKTDPKQDQNAAAKPAVTCDDSDLSPGDTMRRRSTSGPSCPQTPIPVPKPVPNYLSGNESSNSTWVEPEPSSAASATPGADLVRENISGRHPGATLTTLRMQASELLRSGTDRDIVAAALQLWNDKPGVGNGRTILASLCSEVIKTRNGPRTKPRQASSDLAFAQAQALKNNPARRLELE
ncbi:hypothetical protein [Mycolicibacterium houstonense]|uniref:hypothetical protein n=1 Tax=Mycolicibacterium houstonense TaxID=146021 RepID=UPI000A51D9C4|nr:hypothetical protein [Mycolicibacterium houstonense]